MFISYAQNFEDVLLNRILKDQKSGFYIDVGAHHPTNDSVTKSFYDRGWKGINIEPVQEFFKLLEKERPDDLNLNFVVSDSQAELEFFELVGTGFSTLNSEMAKQLAEKRSLDLTQYTVQSQSLANICRQYVRCPIDFLKIDVEGWEEKVILSHDWVNFRPKIIIVEATIPDSPIRCKTQIPNFLNARNYQKVYFDGLNDFYIAEEVNYLAEYFATPVNVFDDFISFKVFQQKQHINNLEGFITQKDNEIFNLTKCLEENDKEVTLQNRLLVVLKNEKEDQIFEIKRLQDILTKLQTKHLEEIKAYETQIFNSQNQLNTLQRQLSEAQNWVVAMESSKFWQIRKKWFQIKKTIGLPTE